MEVDENLSGDGFIESFKYPDEDACDSENIENSFINKYHILKHHCIPNTSLGCLISANNSKEVSFISTKDTVIHFDINSFTEKQSFKPHSGLITDLKFSSSNPNLLYTSSLDATIKMWDMRCNKEDAAFVVTTADKKMPITAFDVSNGETVICGGTELVTEDVFLLFWDIRQNNQLGGYWESHSDNITCVKFNKFSSNSLATAGCDGIINIFDISQPKEDDSLIYTLNTEDIVDTFIWPSIEKDKLVCFTDVHSVQLWDIKDSSAIRKFDRKDLSNAMKRSAAYECYCVPLLSEGTASDPIILTGSGLEHTNYSCLRTLKLDMQTNKLKPHGMLLSDKYEVAQCAVYFEDEDSFITLGEDGSINAWRLNVKPNNLKVQAKIRK